MPERNRLVAEWTGDDLEVTFKPNEEDPMDGAALIAAERNRQVADEGWTPDHDDTHRLGPLRQAAKAYASDVRADSPPPPYWPWEASWWKPSDDPVRNLVKAGALLAAEIDRLRRLDASVHEGEFVA